MDNATGAAGERFAAADLARRGYVLLERNYRCRFGEIDIVARDARYLVFVEVKTRGENSIADPLEAVSAAKRRKIVRTALRYLETHATRLQPRFDVAAVRTRAGVPESVRFVENAFPGTDAF